MSKKTNLIVGAAATVAATSLLVGCNLYGKEEKYTITFVTNGGEMIAPVEIEWGGEYKVNVVPSRTGYAFKEFTDFTGKIPWFNKYRYPLSPEIYRFNYECGC